MSYDLDEFDNEVFEEIKLMMKHRFGEMVEGYIEDAENYIHQIKEGFAQNDKEKVAQNAHPLKSSSASIGIMSVANIAKDLECQSKESIENDSGINHLQVLVEPLDEAFTKAKRKIAIHIN